MASLFTQFKTALGLPVSYAEVDLGLDPNGVPKRVPQSAPSDAAGAPLYAAGVIPALDGTDATGVTPPAGGVGVRGWLSGIYAKLSAPLTVQGTVTVTDGSGPLTVDGTVALAAGALTGLAQDGADATGVAAPTGGAGIRGWLSGIYAKLAGTLNVSAAALPLPAGAAKDATLASILTALGAPLQAGGSVAVSNGPTGYALDASLQSILATLQAQRAETLWTDDTGAFFVRIDVRGTITWTDPTGNASTGPGAGARPAAGSSMLVDSTRYQATAAATGYAVGDYLAHVVTLDPKTGASVGDFWINATQATKLAAAPAAANIAPISPLPTGAAKDSSVLAGNTLLQALVNVLPTSLGQKAAAQSLPVVLSSDGPFATNFGVTTDAAATSDAGAFGFIALFKRSLGYLGTLAGAVTSSIVQVATRSNAPRVTATGPLAAANATVTLALDGMSTVVVQLSGTWAGTVGWLASVDGGASYFPVNLIPYAGGAAVGSTTGNGQWEFACGGLTHLQAQMSAFTSGSASALIAATNGAKSLRVGAPTANPVPTREQPGVTPAQSYVAVTAFVSGNTAGTGGTNATVALAVTTTGNTGFLSIDNTGSADAEVWFGALPTDANVGQSPKKGKLLAAGTGLFFDVRIPVGPIYVTAAATTGLSVVTG